MRTIKQHVIELDPGENLVVRTHGAEVKLEAGDAPAPDDSQGSSLFIRCSQPCEVSEERDYDEKDYASLYVHVIGQ
jgi:hypothetical protein